jgi:hypothetical protein
MEIVSMKKISLMFNLFFIITLVFSVKVYADWELYDDFNTGSTIDTEKWGVDDSSGTITIENQRAKFVHAINHPNDSLYLNFHQNPETIAGIRATVNVASCTGDVRARVVGYAGKVGSDHIWSGVQLQESVQRVYVSAILEGPPPTYTAGDSLHYAELQSPVDVEGTTFVVTIRFHDDCISYAVEGLGDVTYTYASAIDPATDIWRAIGTRSSNGDGPCTVYFDDVYVYRP